MNFDGDKFQGTSWQEGSKMALMFPHGSFLDTQLTVVSCNVDISGHERPVMFHCHRVVHPALSGVFRRCRQCAMYRINAWYSLSTTV